MLNLFAFVPMVGHPIARLLLVAYSEEQPTAMLPRLCNQGGLNLHRPLPQGFCLAWLPWGWGGKLLRANDGTRTREWWNHNPLP